MILFPVSQSQNFNYFKSPICVSSCSFTDYRRPHLAANEYSDLSRSRARSSECVPAGALASPRKDSTLLPILARGAGVVVVVIGTLVVVLRGPLVVLGAGGAVLGAWVVLEVLVVVVVIRRVVVGRGVVEVVCGGVFVVVGGIVVSIIGS